MQGGTHPASCAGSCPPAALAEAAGWTAAEEQGESPELPATTAMSCAKPNAPRVELRLASHSRSAWQQSPAASLLPQCTTRQSAMRLVLLLLLLRTLSPQGLAPRGGEQAAEEARLRWWRLEQPSGCCCCCWKCCRCCCSRRMQASSCTAARVSRGDASSSSGCPQLT
jgi:hypothetical protein